MKNNNRKHEFFHCIIFFITMIFLSIKKHWIISFIYFILLICLLNQLTSSFIDYNYHKYYISISMFFVTSTLALYVFLYRERKDTNNFFRFEFFRKKLNNIKLHQYYIFHYFIFIYNKSYSKYMLYKCLLYCIDKNKISKIFFKRI